VPHRAASGYNLRYIALVIAVALAGALATSIALIFHLESQPDEIDLAAVSPWTIAGIALGAVLWYVLDINHRRRSRSRRRHRSRREALKSQAE
jgi:hypothetical protein